MKTDYLTLLFFNFIRSLDFAGRGGLHHQSQHFSVPEEPEECEPAGLKRLKTVAALV